MSNVIPWRPGMAFSEEAIMALVREARRGDISPKDAAVYLREGLGEAERVGATKIVNQTLPMLAVMCQVTGAIAESIRLLRRHRQIDQSPESIELLITMLAYRGLFRAALRVERQAIPLGFPRAERTLLAAIERARLPVGSLLAIHHDAKRIRPQIPSADGVTMILEERGRQDRNVHPYTIRWAGAGNELLNRRRWRLDVRNAGDKPAAFLDLARRLAYRMGGVVFDPKNKVLHASASRFFVPQSAS